MKKSLLIVILITLLVIAAACSSKTGSSVPTGTAIKTVPVDGLTATLSNITGQLKQGDQEVTLAFTDSSGKSVDVGAVSLNFHMPAMGGMSAMNDAVEILLVEDNPSDVKLALHAFRTHRIANNVQVVRDGAEALEFLFCTDRYVTRRMEDGPKVVLLDLKLPLVDGIEVLRLVKSDSRTQHIPIVVLTSSVQDQDLAECYKLGVNSYIVKPVDFEQFVEVVRQMGLYWLLMNKSPPPPEG